MSKGEKREDSTAGKKGREPECSQPGGPNTASHRERDRKEMFYRPVRKKKKKKRREERKKRR